jgi:hypothetical protein
MNALNINTKTEVITEVKVGDVPIYDVLSEAKALAHNVLFEISIFKQKHNIEDYDFKFEADCCKFLDLIGD